MHFCMVNEGQKPILAGPVGGLLVLSINQPADDGSNIADVNSPVVVRVGRIFNEGSGLDADDVVGDGNSIVDADGPVVIDVAAGNDRTVEVDAGRYGIGRQLVLRYGKCCCQAEDGG